MKIEKAAGDSGLIVNFIIAPAMIYDILLNQHSYSCNINSNNNYAYSC